MNREYYDQIICHVIYDLACSPLLVEALAKLILVTPRGGIYARQWVHAYIEPWEVTSNPYGYRCVVATREKTAMLRLRIIILFTLHTLLTAIICCLELNTGRGANANRKVDY